MLLTPAAISDFANKGTSKHPSLWDGLVSAFVPIATTGWTDVVGPNTNSYSTGVTPRHATFNSSSDSGFGAWTADATTDRTFIVCLRIADWNTVGTDPDLLFGQGTGFPHTTFGVRHRYVDGSQKTLTLQISYTGSQSVYKAPNNILAGYEKRFITVGFRQRDASSPVGCDFIVNEKLYSVSASGSGILNGANSSRTFADDSGKAHDIACVLEWTRYLDDEEIRTVARQPLAPFARRRLSLLVPELTSSATAVPLPIVALDFAPVVPSASEELALPIVAIDLAPVVPTAASSISLAIVALDLAPVALTALEEVALPVVAIDLAPVAVTIQGTQVSLPVSAIDFAPVGMTALEEVPLPIVAIDLAPVVPSASEELSLPIVAMDLAPVGVTLLEELSLPVIALDLAPVALTILEELALPVVAVDLAALNITITGGTGTIPVGIFIPVSRSSLFVGSGRKTLFVPNSRSLLFTPGSPRNG